jgi:hypothetical protein
VNGKLIGPNSLSVPAGISILALETGTGVAPLTLRQLYAGLALHALLGRESSTTVGGATIARLAVATVDEALAALAVPRPGPASSSGPAPQVGEG